MSCVLEPLLQAINLSASRLTPLDMAVYKLNCLYDIHETLKQYQYVEDKLEKLQVCQPITGIVNHTKLQVVHYAV